MKIKIKEIFKYNKLSIIISIITLLIGILIYIQTAIGIPIKENLIIFFIDTIHAMKNIYHEYNKFS